MNDLLIPVINSEKSGQIKYLTIKEANEIFNFRFDVDKDISMNVKSISNKSIIYYNINKHFDYDQLLYLSFRDFQEKLGEYIPLNVILLINHKDKNNKFTMVLSHNNLKEQFEMYSDFEKHYDKFNTLFNVLDNNKEISIYYIGNNKDITCLSVLFFENYNLYDLLINSLSKMVTELDNSENKLFKYQDEFSWTNLLSDYIFNNIDLD